MAVQTKIQVRRDTAANWTSVNPTLAAGEFGYETNTGKLKVGDGATAWASLSYIGASGGAISSDTAPVGPTAGSLWFKSDTAQTFVYYNDGTSSQWVEIGAVSQNTVADILTTTNATLAATQASIEIGVIIGAY